MMRNPEQTIGNMADKSNMTLISYIDDEGYPTTKAMLKLLNIKLRISVYQSKEKSSILWSDKIFNAG